MSDILSLLDTLDGLMVAMTPGPYCRAHHGAWELQARPNQRLADFGTIDHAADDAQAVQALLNTYPRLSAALRAVLTPADEGEREAREALAATEAPPTHHHSWRLYCFNHGHDVDTSTGSTEPPTWATWSRPCRRCDAMGEDCREFGVEHSEWDTDTPQTVAADHLRHVLALLDATRAARWDEVEDAYNRGIRLTDERHEAEIAELRAKAADAAREREAIVAWLRDVRGRQSMVGSVTGIADDIERGAHNKVTP